MLQYGYLNLSSSYQDGNNFFFREVGNYLDEVLATLLRAEVLPDETIDIMSYGLKWKWEQERKGLTIGNAIQGKARRVSSTFFQRINGGKGIFLNGANTQNNIGRKTDNKIPPQNNKK